MALSISSRAASSASSAGLPALALLAALLVTGTVQAAAADSPAGAGDAAARQQAHASLVEGVELLRQRQFAAALTRFDQAYALVPSPNIHYDRGLAYAGLGRDAEALRAFDSFLAEADHAPPGTREKAERQRLTLRAHVATLDVFSDLAGAQVTLDGRPQGVTPLGHALYLDPGVHEVAVRNAATGATAAERVAAAAGQKLTVRLHLDAAANARVARAPRGAGPVGAAAIPEGGGARAAGATVSETAAPMATRTDPSGDGEPRARSTAHRWSLAAATLGVVLLGAGGTFGLLAQREADSLTSDSRNAPPGGQTDFDEAKQTNGLRYDTLKWVFLGTGAAALAAGAVLYSVGRRDERAETRSGTRLANGARDSTRPARAGIRLGGAPLVTGTFAGASAQMTF